MAEKRERDKRPLVHKPMWVIRHKLFADMHYVEEDVEFVTFDKDTAIEILADIFKRENNINPDSYKWDEDHEAIYSRFSIAEYEAMSMYRISKEYILVKKKSEDKI